MKRAGWKEERREKGRGKIEGKGQKGSGSGILYRKYPRLLNRLVGDFLSFHLFVKSAGSAIRDR